MTITNSSRRTVDDGYNYPKNSTGEEKAEIDSQEYEAWFKAGKPGSITNPTAKTLTNDTKLQLLTTSSENFFNMINYSGLMRFNL